MKTVLLAGGFGTRLSEYTDVMPKPMVRVGNKPILWHIMERYAKYGYTDFLLALGYRADYVKEYFLNYTALNSDFTINLGSGKVKATNDVSVDWDVTLVDTGLNTMTGGRIKRLADYIGNQRFFLTYGDGVSNLNIDELLKFHKAHGKMITVTAVRPAARFGEIEISEGRVQSFHEKPQLQEGWINGGFFVVEPDFLNYIKNDDIMLEREPLERAVAENELMAYCHDGFWQCMDTKRDHEALEKMYSEAAPPWLG